MLMATSSSSSIICSSRYQQFPRFHLNPNPLKSQFLIKLPPIHRHQSSSYSQILSAKSFNGGGFRFGCSSRRRRSKRDHLPQRFGRKPKFRIFASREEEEEKSHFSTGTTKNQIFIGVAITIVLAVANRVLYKLALVPMKEYPFFLAQVTTFGYVLIYFSILYLRYCTGTVTKEMLALPKSRFMVIGILEALGVAAGMSSGAKKVHKGLWWIAMFNTTDWLPSLAYLFTAMLPGPTIPILNQTFLVWQLMFSTLILGRKYSFSQILGCLLVAAGVVVALASGSNEGQLLSHIEFLWPALLIASSALQAGASILKEFVFIDAAKRLKGKPLDIFVVNSFGSGFQALFVLLFLPFLSNLKGIPFTELPSYLKSGAACFLNIGGKITDCQGAPLLPLLFIATNMAFNISLLNLVRISSAVVSSLVTTLAVPITIYVLTLPLPYLPEGAILSPFFLVGSVVLVLGLLVYYLPQPANPAS